MITLLLTVFLVVLISAICSMTEAALYSVPWTYIENLREKFFLFIHIKILQKIV